MNIRTIAWKNNKIKIIDQTKLPQSLKYIYIDNIKDLWQAIKTMRLRGAPALGVAGALGVYLGIKDFEAEDFREFKQGLESVACYLNSSRPTARNLSWGIERVGNAALKDKAGGIEKAKKLILKEGLKIIEEDRASCRKIGSYGAGLFEDKDSVLTICNAGILATIDYGTALGVIYRAKEEGKRLKIYACETRPLLQGSRLTAWELKRRGVDVTIICDNMAATLMQQGKINKVIAGADRIALNGDTANKVGTYNLAILSKYHSIPFYIAAPVSTFDPAIKEGKDIPIEERASEEVRSILFRREVASAGVKVFNPAFDITEHDLIRAIITDKGIIRPPYNKNISKLLC